MKKSFFFLFFTFLGFSSFASSLPIENELISKGKQQVAKLSSPTKMLCCSTASTTYQGEHLTCTVCAESCTGPNGSEAQAADCLMDQMVPPGE